GTASRRSARSRTEARTAPCFPHSTPFGGQDTNGRQELKQREESLVGGRRALRRDGLLRRRLRAQGLNTLRPILVL
ncbi:MAG: Ribulose bisphosphate carboxylase large chain, partial [uncultured Segetibacter sp.]